MFTFDLKKLNLLRTRSYSKSRQYFLSILTIVLAACACFFLVDYIGYRAVALILLLLVSVNAILFDIYPVILSALTSAIIWNFFFIPPILTFHIGTPEDGLMFLLYFVIVSINAILTYKIREVEKKERDEKEKFKTIKLYNTLLNSLSHELRTPIATIMASVDTLQFSEPMLTESNKRILLEQIHLASQRLNEQVENLLNMSRLESGMLKLNPTWCDINEVVRESIAKLEATQQTKVNFSENGDIPFLKLDTGIVSQLLYNILNNAFQHNNREIQVDITITLQDDKELILSILDNGKGVPESEHIHLFEKFYRLPTSGKGGTGLGLSIVKGYVDALNGTIHVQNNIPTGLIFTICIPVEVSYINKLKNE